MDFIFDIFSQYGILIIFVIIFLEHLNTPGLAASIILAAIGFLVHRGEISFLGAIVICFIAGVLANLVLYAFGYFLGAKVVDYIARRFPKTEPAINKAKKMSNNTLSRVSCRFLPVVRTIIPLIEGSARVDFLKFTIGAVIGVSIYNTAFVIGGYYLASVTNII